MLKIMKDQLKFCRVAKIHNLKISQVAKFYTSFPIDCFFDPPFCGFIQVFP